MLPYFISSSSLLPLAIFLRLTTHHCFSIKLDEQQPLSSNHYRPNVSLAYPVSLDTKVGNKKTHLHSYHNIRNTESIYHQDLLDMHRAIEDGKPLKVDAKSSSHSRFLQVSLEMQDMLDLINEERRHRSLSELCFNSKLNEAAQIHSYDMRDNVFFSHEGSDGSQFWERIDNTGYVWRNAAENIATHWSIDLAHQGLMESQGHRRNILNKDIEHLGLGITKYTSGFYQGNFVITQVFGMSNTDDGCLGSIASVPIDPAPEYDTSNSCEDSILQFKHGKKFFTCDWVKKKSSKRCTKKGVPSHCPKTCSYCLNCEDSVRKFKLKEANSKELKCRWAQKNSKFRCEISGIKETCRYTCGQC